MAFFVGEFAETFAIARQLLLDSHDLIHQAVGKRDRNAEESFLTSRYKTMPRTMLRYVVEKFPEELWQQYLRGEVE